MYEQIEERRLFSFEERQKILKKSKGICARCGKTLTTRDMTVEHIIPLSRGGTNDEENLIALCYDCNQLKGNMLYVPMGFYAALIGSQRLIDMQEHVSKWFKTVREEFDIERFPLIAPKTNLQVTLGNRGYSKIKYSKELQIQWQLVGDELRYTIEPITGIDIDELRAEVNKAAKREEDSPVTLYSLHKVTNDRIMAVAAVSYKKNKNLFVYIPWCEVSAGRRGPIVRAFVQQLFNSIEDIAGYRINGYIVHACDYESVAAFNPDECSYEMQGHTALMTGTNRMTGNQEWVAIVENHSFEKMRYECYERNKKTKKKHTNRKKKKKHSYAG